MKMLIVYLPGCSLGQYWCTLEAGGGRWEADMRLIWLITLHSSLSVRAGTRPEWSTLSWYIAEITERFYLFFLQLSQPSLIWRYGEIQNIGAGFIILYCPPQTKKHWRWNFHKTREGGITWRGKYNKTRMS